MGEEGLEPSHLAVPDPKSGASTSFATRPDAPRAVFRTYRETSGGRQHAAALCGKTNGASPFLERPRDESGGNRTHNLWIKSPLLCQLSYAPGTALGPSAA